MVVPTAEEKARFGKRLRHLRQARGLSAQGLADMLVDGDERPTRAAVSGWERGEFAPRQRTTVFRLEELLGAVGDLAPLLGYSADAVVSRLDAIENRLEALEQQLRGVLDRGRRRGSR